MSEGRVIGLMGPTGVGKTAVAVELARLLGCGIISCDSMQVYAGFPVLTNQPLSVEERPDLHELVGFLDPRVTMSAGEFAKRVDPLVKRSIAECGWALLVGGSGLYMRAALAPLAARGPADPELRRALEERADTQGVDALHEELARLDPEAAAAIDRRNARRVIRALEGVRSAGVKWSGRSDLWDPVYHHPTTVFGLGISRETLVRHIEVRTLRMLQSGAVQEVARFREDKPVESTRPGLPGICSAIGYREIAQYLEGVMTLAETAERISVATRRYARRQETWLRRVKDAVMIDVRSKAASDTAREIARSAQETER